MKIEPIAVVRAAIETVYLDGIDSLVAYHDAAKETVWGEFKDGEKSIPYSYDYRKGTLTY